MTSPSSLDRPDSPAAVKPVLRGWQHLAAFAVTVVVGPILVAGAPDAGDAAVLAVYVLSIAALFGVSAAFHLRTWSPGARRIMRRADHTTIFLAIAGSYTAVIFLTMHGWVRTLMLCLIWAGALGGIAFRQLWLDAPKWAVAVPYVIVGWSALAVLPQLVHTLGGLGFSLLVLGGLFYTAGAVVYALRRPNPVPGVYGYHEVFHSCTIAGAALHFVVIAIFALPLST